MAAKRALVVALVLAGVLAGARGAEAQAAEAASAKPAASDNYDEQLARFLREARSAEAHPAGGASWMAGLSLDPRARKVNDLITIHVVESIAASGTADSALAKSSDAKAGVPNLFGLEKKVPSIIDPTSLASLKTDNNFKGSGTTNRRGDLTANLTARVSEVLPNGDLVVEGIREIAINGDRQIVVLSGIVRVADIAPGNMVLSTSMGQLRTRYFGNGLIKDNLKPGWLVRVLNKIF